MECSSSPSVRERKANLCLFNSTTLASSIAISLYGVQDLSRNYKIFLKILEKHVEQSVKYAKMKKNDKYEHKLNKLEKSSHYNNLTVAYYNIN
jgi:hypothetical protein